MQVLDFILHYLGIFETSLVKYVCTLLLDEGMCRVAHLVKFTLFNHKRAVVNIKVGYREVKDV